MAVVVVLWMLDAGLGVDAGLRSSASVRAASRRSGGGACRPASETFGARAGHGCVEVEDARSEEHTSELQSLRRISYAVFC